MRHVKNKKTRNDKIYDSLGQAAAALHIPKWILSGAKAHGCNAFSGGRVDGAKLRGWLGKHGAELQSNLSPVQTAILQRIRLQCERIEFDLAVERGDYLPRTDVYKAIDTANGIVIREIDRAIECDLPGRLEGLPAIEIKKMIRKKFDQIFAQLPKHFAAAAAKKTKSDDPTKKT